MDLTRRQLCVAAAALVAVASTDASAAEDDTVLRLVESFRAAQFACDEKALEAFCANELSYSHSDGHIEDKATFLKNATSGRYVFNALEYRAPTVRVVGPVGIARFTWVAKQTWADGKVTDTSMAILMVWLRQGEDWKLVARSATKV